MLAPVVIVERAAWLRAELDRHNHAYYVLDADPLDRPSVFRQEVRKAVARYGLAGFNGPEDPKRQLTGWALV